MQKMVKECITVLRSRPCILQFYIINQSRKFGQMLHQVKILANLYGRIFRQIKLKTSGLVIYLIWSKMFHQVKLLANLYVRIFRQIKLKTSRLIIYLMARNKSSNENVFREHNYIRIVASGHQSFVEMPYTDLVILSINFMPTFVLTAYQDIIQYLPEFLHTRKE